MERSQETTSAERLMEQSLYKDVGASFRHVMYLDRGLLQTVKKKAVDCAETALCESACCCTCPSQTQMKRSVFTPCIGMLYAIAALKVLQCSNCSALQKILTKSHLSFLRG